MIQVVAKMLATLTAVTDAAIVGFLIFFIGTLLAANVKKKFDTVVTILKPHARILSFIIALTATVGSLFFSEIAKFTPCILCWWQRIFMYPQVILIGLGILCLMVEFYTPGFGLPGICGIALLSIVFISNFIAGMAGYEPVIIFAIGFLLVMLELILFPGVLVMAITGGILMVGSLIWSLADVWPKTGGGFDFDYSRIINAAYEVAIAIAVAILLFAVIYRFLPKRLLVAQFVLDGASGNAPASAPASEPVESDSLPQTGSVGVAVSNLRPSGTVEIDGVRYEATLTVGAAERGQKVQIVGRKDFELLVKIVS